MYNGFSPRRLSAVMVFESGQVGRSSPKECPSGAVELRRGFILCKIFY